MTVQELKELLENIDGNRVIIMAKDAEGNQFSPLLDIDDESAYRADNQWSGQVGLEKLTPELKASGYTDEDVVGGEPALVLWPTN